MSCPVLFLYVVEIVVVIAAILIAYLISAPLLDFNPVAYKPPLPSPSVCDFSPNDSLSLAEELFRGQVTGPESTAVDKQGRIYMGCADGFVKRTNEQGGLDNWVRFNGRPLGMEFSPEGNLVVCVPGRGVFAVNEDGHARLLVDTVSGKKMKLEDDVDVSSEGVVYFSDASTKYGFDDYVLDILEGRAYGRLLSFDPKTNATNVLLDRLHFANGVTLSSQEDFVLVAETTRYRILRYWLKGPRMGTHDVFANNLPGLVDNIQSNRRGTIWVAISMARDSMLDWITGSRLARTALAKLPSLITLATGKNQGYIMALREDNGVPVKVYRDPRGRTKTITGARQVDGFLYVSSLTSPFLARLKL